MIHAFGDLEWDDDLFELRRGGEVIAATPRVLDSIAYLIKHRGRVVSKDELLETLWKGVVVSEASLSQTIMLARRALGDEGDQQRMIKTVRGRGFRFVMPIAERSSAQSSSPALEQPVLAGAAKALERPAESARLWARFEAARRGEGSLILVEGEPGIGKTTFVEQFAGRARAVEARVFWGRAWEAGGAPPFWPWVQVLRAMARQWGSVKLRAAMGPHERELLPLVSGSIDLEPGAPPLEALYVGRAQRFRVFDGMASLLRRAAPSGQPPLVVVLEDLHAADDASIELLRFVSQDLADAALLMLGTFRDLAVARESTLGLVLGGPLHNAERITLRGFSAPEVRSLFESETKTTLAERVALKIHELSGGNPFLVSELARVHPALDSEDSEELATLTSIRVPERVARAVRLRVQALPEPARELLSIASVLGKQLALSQLCALGGLSEAETLERLTPALKLGLVGISGTDLAFAHAMVHGTLYGDLALSRRVELHRRAGELLEAYGAKSYPMLYELARHFFHATGAGLQKKARAYACEAARAAEQRLAFATAASLYDQSARLAELDPRDHEALYESLIAAGQAFYRAGEFEAAVRRYQHAAGLARAANDAEKFAWAVFWHMLARSASMLFDAPLLELVREALQRLPETDSALRAMLLGHSALGYNSLGDPELRLTTTEAGVGMARRSGNDFALTIALSAQLWQLSGVVAPQRELEIADELVLVARRAGRDVMLLNGLQQRMAVRLTLADFPAARADFAEFSAVAQGRGLLSHLYWVELWRATWATWSGKLDDARQLSDHAARLGARIQEPLSPVLHALQTFYILAEQGRAHELSDEALSVLPRDDAASTRAMWLALCLWRADVQRAQALYSELCADDFRSVPRDLHRLWVLATLSGLAAMLGDRPRAERLYDLLAPHADLAVVAPGTLHYIGPTERFLGLLASSLGAHERAYQHFDGAVEQCRRAGAQARLAQVEAESARARSAAGAG